MRNIVGGAAVAMQLHGCQMQKASLWQGMQMAMSMFMIK